MLGTHSHTYAQHHADTEAQGSRASALRLPLRLTWGQIEQRWRLQFSTFALLTLRCSTLSTPLRAAGRRRAPNDCNQRNAQPGLITKVRGTFFRFTNSAELTLLSHQVRCSRVSCRDVLFSPVLVSFSGPSHQQPIIQPVVRLDLPTFSVHCPISI